MPEPTSSTSSTTPPKAKAGVPKSAELSAAIREEVVASVKQAQQFTLDAVSTWVDVIGKVAPEIPTVPFVPARSEVVEGLGTFVRDGRRVVGVAAQVRTRPRRRPGPDQLNQR